MRRSGGVSALDRDQQRHFEVSITVQASGGSSDTQMCHRFLNFETHDSRINEVAMHEHLQEYLRILKQNEGTTAVLFSKVNHEFRDPMRQWTVCIVFNPKVCHKLDSFFKQKPIFTQGNSSASKL
jgi:hypothetical protein